MLPSKLSHARCSASSFYHFVLLIAPNLDLQTSEMFTLQHTMGRLICSKWINGIHSEDYITAYLAYLVIGSRSTDLTLEFKSSQKRTTHNMKPGAQL
jgi:hypothetical protein